MTGLKRMVGILLVVVMMVMSAGCSSKGSEDEAADAVAQVEDVTASMNEGQLTHYAEQQKLKAMGSYFDPELDGIDIMTMDPNLEIVGRYLNDRRPDESSNQFSISVMIVNNGAEPVWVFKELRPAGVDVNGPVNCVFLDSGERMNVSYQGRLRQTLSDVPDLKVVSSAGTIVPEVASEFTGFTGMELTNSGNLDQADTINIIDVHSIDFVVKNEEKGWESAVLRVSSRTDMYNVGFMLDPMQHVYTDLKAGEIKEVEVSFQGKSASEIYRLRITCDGSRK